MSSQAWINLAYLVASMLFIVAFKLMTGPRTAVKGNYLGAAGMAIALLAACFEKPVVDRIASMGSGSLVLLGIAGVIGAAIGLVLIKRVNPQSFHWTMQVHWPIGVLALSAAALIVAALIASLLATRNALGAGPLAAVRQDW